MRLRINLRPACSNDTSLLARNSELVARHACRADHIQAIGRALVVAAAREPHRQGCSSKLLWVLPGNPVVILVVRR